MSGGAETESVRAYRREAFGLVVLIVVATVAFVFTRAFAARNGAMRRNDAASWYRLAQAQVSAGRPGDAVSGFRRASAMDRENPTYRLALASALAAGGEDEGARQVLIGLRQFAPDDPQVNLQLARLEARRHDLAAAVQYYQNAIYGLWPPTRLDERRGVRQELIEYLLGQGQKRRALSELLIFSANSPDDVASQRRLGRLLLRAGDPRRALEHFVRALRLAPADADALAGAGEAAFDDGDYGRARTYLSAVDALPDRLMEMRAIAEIVVTSDPLAPRLQIAERQRRLTAGLERVSRRLEKCDLPSERDEVAAFATAATLRHVRADPDLIDRGVDLIGRVEQSASRQCGGGTPADRGWQTIASRHGAARE